MTLITENLTFTQATTHFLTTIANAEKGRWESILKNLPFHFPEIVKDSVTKTLNQLNSKIIESDQLPLIDLFRRAVHNYNDLSKEKAEPVTSYYKHYQKPPFLIPHTHVTLDVKPSTVTVTTELKIKRNSTDVSLILNGVGHKLLEVYVDGALLPEDAYKTTPSELILLDISEKELFNVRILSEIDPFNNESLSGLYVCNNWLTSHCEPEGARRIFYTLDRPDVLSKITTTIIADQNVYPYRLSNGNLALEKTANDGRAVIVWEDPIPKPSYLYACVLGNLSKISDEFCTRSGKRVSLEVYVEKGKETRAEYSLFALKKAMEFDEKFFDREYDLTCMKMVSVPAFNIGAMENKGLMIFNDTRILVDSASGTDEDYRTVAGIVAHEYFHNWSGNRVTVRNWFELALKEAFTDFRALLFTEWLFGSEFIRPESVTYLKEQQFPEELTADGHPIMVESYVSPETLYDQTTYVKGREVFRTLKTYIDTLVPDGFRQAQNLYFSRYDGQAVTFLELLKSADEILKPTGETTDSFKRWFTQPGTPVLDVELKYDETNQYAALKITQSCPHPKTGEKQKPFVIPFSFEFLDTKGRSLSPITKDILKEENQTFHIPTDSKPIPIFMHDYCAPVILNYPYKLEELACIIMHTSDSFSRFEAGERYNILAIKEIMHRIDSDEACDDILCIYKEALQSDKLSLLEITQLLTIPSIRTLSQAYDRYDFIELSRMRTIFKEKMLASCKKELIALLDKYQQPKTYAPNAEQMQIREFRNLALELLSKDDKYLEIIYQQFQTATNFNDYYLAFSMLVNSHSPNKQVAVKAFYEKWKNDKAVFNQWLRAQSGSHYCKIEDLIQLEAADGFDKKNPNHIRSVTRSFVNNLSRFHDASGAGYKYVVDKIIEVGQFNPSLAFGYIAQEALVDIDKIPKAQQTLFLNEIKRLLSDEIPVEVRHLAKRIIDTHK